MADVKLEKRLRIYTESMTDAQSGKYRSFLKPGMTTETKLHWAESVLRVGGRLRESRGRATELIRESEPIIRNNGGNFSYVDAREGMVNEADVKLFKSLGMTEAEIKKVSGGVPKAVEEAGPLAVNDYHFAKALGLSESDSVKVAVENLTRDSSSAVRRRRGLIKD